MQNPIKNKDLKRKIIEISYKYKLSHIGSCLTAVDIIDEIYATKKVGEKFVLSSGHGGLALYCVLEKYNDPNTGKSAEEIWRHHGTHPDRCEMCGINCSSGSLGHGLGIAVGMALADRSKNVYCLISDGECSEGSIHESLRIIDEYKVKNLKIHCNWNGWGAYRKIETREYLYRYLHGAVNCHYTGIDYLPFLKGQDAHYNVMNKKEYEQAMHALK